jgi:glycine cleavage system aminomethyltransferase T
MEEHAKDKAGSDREIKMFTHSPFVPYSPDVGLYSARGIGTGVGLTPFEYTGWRDETMSWKTSCYLHGGLNPTTTYRIKGPEAINFLASVCVNNFENFPIGSGKHGIMCSEQGLIMMHGIIIRLGEDDFLTYWLAPYITYMLEKSTYKAVGEDYTGKVFLFQIAGPRSLEVLETATGECLHDIKFFHHRMSSIDGMEIRILRVGMAGSLAYEAHGRIEDTYPVYNAILKAGQEFGIRRLGLRAYSMNHTEDGFPQATIHFPYPWGDDPGFMEYLMKSWSRMIGAGGGMIFRGSMGPDPRLRYRNPVELGWAGMIKFNHDFVGRKALEKAVANPRRKMVTLVWNPEDIIDVYASQFRPGEPYANMDAPNDMDHSTTTFYYHADQVKKDGKVVGISSGRAYSYHYRQMISLCSVDTEYSAMGTEVTVVWGDPGTRQKEIRATVSRFPYLNENRNEKFDVNTIPCRAKK